jgi:transcriptional regulator with XRE-family HTH domain
MTASVRQIDRADRRTRRQLIDVGDEFRERRLQLALSQSSVAAACHMSRNHYGQIERGQARHTTLLELNRIGAALGLSGGLRYYPTDVAIRDAGQAKRLLGLLAVARPPLQFRHEVALPRRDGAPEWRAWDAVLFGEGRRTTIELEMRLRDVQALRRRIDLKRRDDPAQAFLLAIADTDHNRRVLREFESFFADLPRLRPSVVAVALAAGRHPPSGIVLV